jgi:large subunit ribosomal protein L30
MAEKKILVTQTRSSIRNPKPEVATLKALGLGRIGKKATHRKDDTIMGMIRRVSHLVQAREVN